MCRNIILGWAWKLWVGGADIRVSGEGKWSVLDCWVGEGLKVGVHVAWELWWVGGFDIMVR